MRTILRGPQTPGGITVKKVWRPPSLRSSFILAVFVVMGMVNIVVTTLEAVRGYFSKSPHVSMQLCPGGQIPC